MTNGLRATAIINALTRNACHLNVKSRQVAHQVTSAAQVSAFKSTTVTQEADIAIRATNAISFTSALKISVFGNDDSKLTYLLINILTYNFNNFKFFTIFI